MWGREERGEQKECRDGGAPRRMRMRQSLDQPGDMRVFRGPEQAGTAMESHSLSRTLLVLQKVQGVLGTGWLCVIVWLSPTAFLLHNRSKEG